MSLNVSACVILFNPTISHVKNILSYIYYIDKLFVIDNSDDSNENLLMHTLKNYDKIDYIYDGQNNGVAFALNLACERSIELGYNWMLTMDQDSSFEPGDLSGFFNNPILLNNRSDVGIITPVHQTQILHSIVDRTNLDFADIKTCMTSGNLLNLKIWKEVGKFNNDLFIDSVDHEYCLRLRYENYRILLYKKYKLNHALGESKHENMIGIKMTSTNHNYIRRYYMTRNRLVCIKLYFTYDPFYLFMDAVALVKEIIKIILIEEDKKKKLVSVLRGIKDFAIGKMGKYDYSN